MKTLKLLSFLLLLTVLNLPAQTAVSGGNTKQTPVPAPSAYRIVDQGANHNVWRRETYEAGPNGEVITHEHQYTELASGLNFFDSNSQQWLPSKEEIDILPQGGASAIQGQHQAYFPGDIYNGVIELVTAEGIHLKSRPVGLSYDDGTNSILIAQLTNSIGYLVSSNEIIYPDAFAGLSADLRYTYTKAGFEQDIILKEQPPTPGSLGLNADSTRLQVLTEFFNPPQPQGTARTVTTAAGNVEDDNLSFGNMTMGHGKAFMIGTNSSSVAVDKQWLELNNRQFLIEEVPVVSIASELENLPELASFTKLAVSTNIVSTHRILPPPRLAKTIPKAILLAKAPVSNHGLVLDYNAVLGTLTNYTFDGDTTYYVSGNTHLNGTNIIEGGAVLKFPASGSAITFMPGATLVSTAEPYHMAILTSVNDNSVGEGIGTGSPMIGTANYLAFTQITTNVLNYLRFEYAGVAVSLSWSGVNVTTNVAPVDNCQFLHCGTVVTLSPDNNYCVLVQKFENVLISQCGTVVKNLDSIVFGTTGSGVELAGQNITVDQVTNLIATWSNDYKAFLSPLTNSILTAVTYQVYEQDTSGSQTVANINHCYINSSSSGIYQTVEGGNYYLANNSPYRNAGTTNIDPTLLAQLRQKTTYPPTSASDDYSANTMLYPQVQRDTDTPDLGYHYDAIDYLSDSLTVESGATLTLTNGVVLALTSTNITVNGALQFSQEITNTEVQEFQSAPLNVLIGSDTTEAYTDVDGNGLPDWWENYYFGTNGLNPNVSLDGDGNSLLYDYLNQINPDQNLQFTVHLGNQHFNTTNATGGYAVLNGVASYEAVLVNDTNLDDAVWSNYDGAVHVNLGPTDGVYQVQMGLKGHAPDSPPVWTGTIVYLDRVPPTLTITNPTNTTVTVPYVQLLGYGDETLLGVTYDVSNAVGVVTNLCAQKPFEQFFDTNTWEYTTDYFQCFDILLTNGLNTITVQATDLAGNVTVTNINLTLDYSLATNPVIKIYWPSTSTSVVGTNFTWRGWVDDSTARVLAQIVDTNGETNIMNGLVERDGKVWVENLPLSGGTNYFTLWVTNAAGLLSTTNMVIVQSALNLTINPVTDDLWDPTVTVSGTFDDFADYAVWVNGVKAINTDGVNWTAYAVPLPAGGTASIQARAIPDTDNGGNGTGGNGGAPVSYDNLGNPDPPQDNDKAIDPARPDEIVTETGSWKGMQDYYLWGDWGHDSWDYSEQTGGSEHEDWWYDDNGETSDMKYRPDLSMISEHDVIHSVSLDGSVLPDVIVDETNGPSEVTPLEEGSLAYSMVDYANGMSSSQVKRVYRMGGTAQNGQQVLVSATADVMEETLGGDRSMVGDMLTLGELGRSVATDDGEGSATATAYAVKAAGSTVDITPSSSVPMFRFSDGAGSYVLTHLTDCTAAGNTNNSRTTIGIGEVVDFGGMPSGTTWSVSGNGTLSSTNGTGTTFTANHNPGSATVTATVGNASIPTTFSVVAPGSIIVDDHIDAPSELGTEDANGTQMGAKTYYNIEISPKTVSFDRVNFREALPPLTVTWPNGDVMPINVQGATNSISFPCGTGVRDEIQAGLRSINLLFNGTNYEDFSYSHTWTDQYQNQSGSWVDFVTINRTTEYHGGNKQCHVIYLGIPGGWQGPFD